MKKKLSMSLVYCGLLAVACRNIDSGQKAPVGNNDPQIDKPPVDTIVFVGKFAKWEPSNTQQYDGNYDAASGIFIICSNQSGQKVPKDQVV